MTRNLQQQVGQLVICGFDGTAMDGRVESLLREVRPGGVILFARNIEAPRQTWQLLRDAQKLFRTPLFRCVDMEGGTVDRLKKIIAPAPSAAQVAATGDHTLYRRHGRLIGDACRALGFNVDFAPVVDLALPPSRSVLGSRAVSPEATRTAAYARAFLRGLTSAGVHGCLKHFPGLGEARLDTHFELPSIVKSWKRFWEEDLWPYRSLHSDTPFVMVAHARYPGIDDKWPASLSEKWVGGVLRKKIGFRGLVIADDLEMAGVLAAASIEEAAVRSLRAGADIFLVCRNEEHVRSTFEAVLRAAERDCRFAARVAESARSVAAYKRRWKLTGKFGAAPSAKKVATLAAALNKLSEQTATELAMGPGTRWD